MRGGLSQREAADAVGVTARTLRTWKAQGLLDDDAGPAANGDGESLAEARRRKEAALAEKHELDAAERRGELVHRELLTDTLTRVRAAIDAVPRRLVGEVAGLLGIPQREALPLLEEAAALVRREVRAELERWSGEEHDAHRGPTPLPDDTPAVLYLRRAGVETIERLRAIEDLEGLEGIGPKRAERIRDWLESDSD